MLKISKLILLLVLLILTFTTFGCNFQQNNILKHFDLRDEKIIWSGDINDPYIVDDSVIVTAKEVSSK